MAFPRQLPIRFRLTLWYVLLMAVTFTALGVFLYALFQRSLMDALDTSLQFTVSQTISSFDVDEDLVEYGQLLLEKTPDDLTSGFAMRLVSSEGAVWDAIGNTNVVWGATEPGFATQSSGGHQWRMFSQPILAADSTLTGWIQAAQSLEPITDTLRDFRDQLLWGIPFVLILAGLGGYFLANRALHPIEHITSTAQEITVHDLSQRLDYQGPEDEIGRLAHTFDRMLARLHDAFRREQRFTSDAAHELRTPLTVLKGQLEVTLSRPRIRAEYQNKLQELSTQVDRLVRLSNAMLFLSRSDQKQLSWEPVSVNLTDLLEVIVEQIQPLADERGLLVQMDPMPELPVFGDPDYLTRLFLNLLDNAVKYTPIGGTITLWASHGSSQTAIAIHNTGEGIPSEHLPYLFNRFYRLDADRSRETGGDGLGLAIAREIVHLHGGEICVESELGQGVTFTVYLPNQ